MKRIYRLLHKKTIKKLKSWLFQHELNELQQVYEARSRSLEQDLDLDTLISLKINKHVNIKLESTLDKLTPQQLQSVLSQAPPLAKNDLLKLIIEDLKINCYRQIVLNQFDNQSNLARGGLVELIRLEEELERRVGEFNSLKEKDIDFNKFDIT